MNKKIIRFIQRIEIYTIMISLIFTVSCSRKLSVQKESPIETNKSTSESTNIIIPDDTPTSKVKECEINLYSKMKKSDNLDLQYFSQMKTYSEQQEENYTCRIVEDENTYYALILQNSDLSLKKVFVLENMYYNICYFDEEQNFFMICKREHSSIYENFILPVNEDSDCKKIAVVSSSNARLFSSLQDMTNYTYCFSQGCNIAILERTEKIYDYMEKSNYWYKTIWDNTTAWISGDDIQIQKDSFDLIPVTSEKIILYKKIPDNENSWFKIKSVSENSSIALESIVNATFISEEVTENNETGKWYKLNFPTEDVVFMNSAEPCTDIDSSLTIIQSAGDATTKNLSREWEGDFVIMQYPFESSKVICKLQNNVWVDENGNVTEANISSDNSVYLFVEGETKSYYYVKSPVAGFISKKMCR